MDTHSQPTSSELEEAAKQVLARTRKEEKLCINQQPESNPNKSTGTLKIQQNRSGIKPPHPTDQSTSTHQSTQRMTYSRTTPCHNSQSATNSLREKPITTLPHHTIQRFQPTLIHPPEIQDENTPSYTPPAPQTENSGGESTDPLTLAINIHRME